MRSLLFFLLSLLFVACQKREKTLFTQLNPEQTGISFANNLSYTEEFNCYTYRSFYNGGGVGLGDVNNDGLVDVFFCGNMQPSRLYLNKGQFKFEDITEKAGVACKDVWATGVAMADVNGDGWLDIYVCKSGKPNAAGVRHNELFINNHDGTFSEQAKAFGLADEGLSTHAAFFDCDHDGDLDCYLLNNSFRSVRNYDFNASQRDTRDSLGGNKLLINNGNRFVDNSVKGGIFGSSIGFGLGVTIGDINRDGWQDIYVSNDFFERDYLYINQKNGVFKEDLTARMPELSLGSMGADMADINNDGFPEVFVTEMLPSSEKRLKTKASFDGWNKYQMNIKNGYHRQFPRNVLQLNNGDGSFSEIGRLAGVCATDWSWGALIADFDNDGLKDIFVANGIAKDLFDQDYLNFMSDPSVVREILNRPQDGGIKKLIDTIPSEKIANVAFKNMGQTQFLDHAAAWGLDAPSFSNGSAYADLDNDGDLDLVVNNVNMPAFVYRNETNEQLKNNHFLALSFVGEGGNTQGLGTQATVYANGQQFYQEVAPMRGFQSCVDARLTFGLGNLTTVDSVVVVFPSGKKIVQRAVTTDQRLTFKEADAGAVGQWLPPQYASVFFKENVLNADFQHIENEFNDFDVERLLFQMNSNEGGKMCKGDVNADGLDDIFVGNAQGATGAVLIQQPDGRFKTSVQPALLADRAFEDVGCTFFDADGDKDLDLLVASGGSDGQIFTDRLYKNDGKGRFSRDEMAFPDKPFATSVVQTADFDADGDIDLFIGGRFFPQKYGLKTSSYILKNDGTGHFKGVTSELAPELKDIGMVTDAAWFDADGDGATDLVVAQEWGPLSIFKNEGGKFKKMPISGSEGWWNVVEVADFNQDGRLDLVAGNHGLNSRFRASDKMPLQLFLNDFDDNGSSEPIICGFNNGKSYPMCLRQDVVSQMPSLKKKYLYFKNYKEQQINDMFSAEKVKNALQYEAKTLASAVFINQGNAQFSLQPLPTAAQLAPIYAIAVADINKDGHLDMVLGGNQSRAKPEVGTYLGSYGAVLLGDGKGQFNAVPSRLSGLSIRGEVRDFVVVKAAGKNTLVGALNNDKLRFFSF